ncbi:dynein axonemal intermediate chain 2-like [Anticarsia gemmatalis]|uniref:dynein axonemal intermediate chain 2-like n=1 Tax=Anticarsia gemmatalis TaxID=129554 RepID=UPI003F76F1B8
MFSEMGPVLCDSVQPSAELQRQYVLRNPVHAGVQVARPLAERRTNTFRADVCNSGANHAEGGWARDISFNDSEATQRYRRRIEKEDGYIHTVMTQSPVMEHYINQNNAIDVYESYYSKMAGFPKLGKDDCRTVNIYRDSSISGGGRPVRSICWEPGGGYRFAVAYLDVDVDRNSRGSLDSYIWDVEYPNRPKMSLRPPCPILDVQYNPREASALAV